MTETAGKPIAVAIAVLEHNGKFLVGVRPPGVPLAGLAEFPGGKIDLGETPEAAAIRECREETGLASKSLASISRRCINTSTACSKFIFFVATPLVLAASICSPPCPFVG
jgi:mutator protein MutT